MDTRIDIPAVHSFDAIRELAAQKCATKRPRAAIVAPHEADTLPALARAVQQGLIDPTVVGDERLFLQAASNYYLDATRTKIIDINQPDLAVRTAARMAAAGEIDIIVQGRIDPDRMVGLLTGADCGISPAGSVLSHVGVLMPVRYPKLMLVTDGLVHDSPDLANKISLLGNLARVSKALGIADPRTAVVTAVEAIHPQMPATTDAAVLAKMYERGQIKGLRVDGPLSFDIAVDFFAAESKGIRNSIVAGQADAILASTKHVAQGVYQAMALFGNCETGGVLVGGLVPVAISFACEAGDARYNSIMLACLMA
ncbi:MAG: phosphate acyltransferase [Candidatus Zixiibacteriota bacterium]